MKILLLNYEYPPIGGGAATATYNLLRQFSNRKDVKIDLVTSSPDKYREEQFSENITVYFLDINKGGNIHCQTNKELLTYSWKAWKFAKQLKKRKDYDLTHAFFGIPCGFIAMLLGIPYIVSLRGSDVPFYNEKYKLLDVLIFQRLSKIIWGKAKNVVANSEGLKQLALKTKSNQRINVIYNGVDIETFQPLSDETETFTVISTSRLIKRKGIEYLIEGFISFAKRKNDVKLIIVGGGNLCEELKKSVKDQKYGDKIEFTGSLDRSKMPEYYQKADVFALPSLNEGMSNSLLEAMASGLAVVVTDTGGTKELVSDDNGIVIKKRSSHEI
ncbi:MAG: glycosyltransferase, partial [Patescibacteria group bacterium]|nr:glycosyltransferase [Patescibacteria group bacterium]